MKIKKQRYSTLKIVGLGLLIYIPFILLSPQITSVSSDIKLIIVLIVFTLSNHFFFKFQLSKVEVQYLENNADFTIESKKKQKYTFEILFILPCIYLIFTTDLKTEPATFVLCALSTIFIIGDFAYRKITKTDFALERLFFCSEQIIWFGKSKKIVDISDIERIHLMDKKLYIREKHGDLLFNTETLTVTEKENLMHQINKTSSQLPVEAEFINDIT